MGQRLNIEIKANGKSMANSYYHWSGYTNSALLLADVIITQFFKNEEPLKEEKDYLFKAIRLLEDTGARLTKNNIEMARELFPNRKFTNENIHRNDGLISIIEEDMEETRQWQEASIIIDLATQKIDISDIFDYDSLKDGEEYLFDLYKTNLESLKKKKFNFKLKDIDFKDFEKVKTIYDEDNFIYLFDENTIITKIE